MDVQNYTRVPALGINEDFINAMSELIIKKEKNKFNRISLSPKNSNVHLILKNVHV